MEILDVIDNISDEELGNCIPVFNKRVANIKKDENSYIISSNKLIRPLEVNETCCYIYNLCDGKNSVSSVIETINKNLIGNYNVVKRDVLYVLFNTWRLNILQWSRGKHPFSNAFNYEYYESDILVKYSVLTNSEINKKIDFHDKNTAINPYVNIDIDYRKININKRIGANAENFFELGVNDEIIFSISLRPYAIFKPVPNILAFDISYIHISDNPNVRLYMERFLRWICNWYIDYMESYVFENSINIYCYVVDNQNNEFEIKLADIGFIKKEV